MTVAIPIDELPIPTSVDDPAFADFARMVAIRNAVREASFGTSLLDTDAAEMLPWLQNQTYYQQRLYAARLDGQVAGVAIHAHEGRDPTPVCWLGVGVHPDYRHRGVGRALADHVEHVARESGHPMFQAQVGHTATPGGPRLAPPSGIGDLPASDPGVRFLLHRRYHLEQLQRVSFLHLPVDPDAVATLRRDARSRAGPDYRIVTWSDPAPEAWLDDLALLNTRMFTDAPLANLEVDTTPWDAARIRSEEATIAKSGRIRLIAAVEHVPSGRLVAFSQLHIPEDRSRPVNQGATLVLTEHRGHRLGLLVKTANIEELARVSPASPVILTSNAEENRPMLDVNDAVGFQPIGYLGKWKNDHTA